MRKMNRTIAAAILAVAVGGGTYAFLGSALVPSAEARWHDQPVLETAYHHLRDAKSYLEAASHDFHGHRVEAIRAVENAMHHVARCAEEEESATKIAPLPLDEHPRLRAALDHLREARHYLHESRSDFHGHRDRAIDALDEAIHQIERCLD